MWCKDPISGFWKPSSPVIWDGILPSPGSHARVPPPLMSQSGVPSSLGSPASWHKRSSANNSAPTSASLPNPSLGKAGTCGPGFIPSPARVAPCEQMPLLCHRLISLPFPRRSSSAPALTGVLNHRPCSRWG